MRRPLLFLLCLHLGCAGLPEGLTAASTIVRGACGAILATDGKRPEEVLAALQEAEKRIMSEVATLAKENADPAVVAALQAGQEANAAAIRETAKQIIALAARPGACPVGDIVAPTAEP